MQLTHYWDCSGQGCDSSTLQPWDPSKYVSPAGYGPQDPNDHGGAMYGEQMWLTGAASDYLSGLLGDDDGCCGEDTNDDGVGGCGKCLLVQNPDAVNADWTAVVMKKNRCPPWSHGCGGESAHFDIAAPGFDNLAYSTANICGDSNTGFASQGQSAALGDWWTSCANTADCAHLCAELPEAFRAGCELFASWGWQRGDPQSARYRVVACPARFVYHVQSLFDANGPTDLPESDDPAPPASDPTSGPGEPSEKCCSWPPHTECGVPEGHYCFSESTCEGDCGGAWMAAR